MKKFLFSLIILLLSSLNCFSQKYTFDFEQDVQGWIPDFADYNVGDSVEWKLSWYLEEMPGIVPKQRGIKMEGENFSDDLFFFMKKEITGLKPNTTYSIEFHIDMVSNEGIETVGGCSCMLKAGASVIEPVKVDKGQHYRLNLNKGLPSSPGLDMDTLGLLLHPFPDTEYHLFTRDNTSHPFIIKTDSEGKIWVIVGAESMFEVFVFVRFAQVRFILSETTNVESNQVKNFVEIYPNPSSEFLNIKHAPDVIFKDVSIVDLMGVELVHIDELKVGKIDISNLSQGAYYLIYSHDNSSFARKFIIER